MSGSERHTHTHTHTLSVKHLCQRIKWQMCSMKHHMILTVLTFFLGVAASKLKFEELCRTTTSVCNTPICLSWSSEVDISKWFCVLCSVGLPEKVLAAFS